MTPRTQLRAVSNSQGRKLILNSMSEGALQEALIEHATAHRWKHYHPWSSVHSVAGWPDLSFGRLHDRQLMFFEVKNEKRRATPEQLEWLALFGAAGHIAAVVRPRHLDLARLALVRTASVRVIHEDGEPVLAPAPNPLVQVPQLRSLQGGDG